jgi:hypothetical protein
MKAIKRALFVLLYILGLALSQISAVAQDNGGPLPPPPDDWWTNTVPAGWTNAVWWTNRPPFMPTNRPPDWTTNPPPFWTNLPPVFTNLPPAWTNLLGGLTNRWWTNVSGLTNSVPPPIGTNSHARTIPPGRHAPPPNLPQNIQGLLEQFQQQRNQLVGNLQSASDQQRQQVLGQLETLRQQLQSQLQEFRRQMVDQAKTMPANFNSGNHFAPLNAPDTPSQPTPGTHGGKPR